MRYALLSLALMTLALAGLILLHRTRPSPAGVGTMELGVSPKR